jgi:hypothetical protein
MIIIIVKNTVVTEVLVVIEVILYQILLASSYCNRLQPQFCLSCQHDKKQLLDIDLVQKQVIMSCYYAYVIYAY